MKWIKYRFLADERNVGTEEEPIIKQFFFDKAMGWNEVNEETAKREAYNGEYTIVDDGLPEPAEAPSDLDKLEAKVTYLAMMTGYDEILEV